MQTLRDRIALLYAALIIMAMTVVAIVVLRLAQQRFDDALDSRLLTEAAIVSQVVAPLMRSGGERTAIAPLAGSLGQRADLRITVIAPDGQVWADSENDPGRMDNQLAQPEVQQALALGSGRATRRSDIEQHALRYVAVPVRADGDLLGVVRLAAPRTGNDSGQRRLSLTIAIAGAVTTVAAIVFATLLAGTVTGPLDRLRAAARALAGGVFDQRVAVDGPAEVRTLVVDFNTMTEQFDATVNDLTHERTRLEALLAAGADAAVALDRGGVVRYVNPAAEALIGRVVGRTFVEAARNHELSGLVRRALNDGERTTAALHIDASDRWFQATASPITGGGDWATLLILHDITEVRRAETTRRDFVANVSHELRTPLAGIKAVVETLRAGAIDDPEVADEFLTRVDGEVDRLVHLVEELLELSRIESGAAPMVMREVTTRDLLARCVERFQHQAERAGIALTLDVPGLTVIRADPERLGQAVGNLIHNALKFTPPGGRVDVSAKGVGGVVRIEVKDTGSGIDPADLPRIFERFYVVDRARSRRGTGLGLAIVKHVVRAHGGTVSVVSTPGRGSIFTIELPASNAAADGAGGTAGEVRQAR